MVLVSFAIIFNPHNVSIHAPARGATRDLYRRRSTKYVSIHAPARGATNLRTAARCLQSVSIHAPARGATLQSEFLQNRDAVSIHAPARGATQLLHGLNAPRYVFQSTRPRGARRRTGERSIAGRRFNPRARAGRDV